MSPPAPRHVLRFALALGILMLAFAAGALAQQGSAEDRLREALRRATVDLRALQDGQAALQASLEAAQKQRDQAQAALDQANAKLAAQPAGAPAQPAAPAQADALAQAEATIATLKQQNAALQAGLARWQSAYQEAAATARARDAEAHRLEASLKANDTALGLARQENAKLVTTATDILHLYRTQDFRSILLQSYEPLLGLKKVELENLVQDYEDKINDHRLVVGYPSSGAAK